MTRNVLASWAGYLVFVAAGFILPRFIDRSIGQTALGVWDFGWSLVSYLGLAQGGIGFSVNRYVPRHRATGDTMGLRCTVSSVMCVQLVAASVVVVLTLVMTRLVPSLLNKQLGAYVSEARWVVLWLGGSIAVQMAFGVFAGVITGCHRWDLHNAINAGFYAGIVAAMIVVLLGGGGLRGIALAYFFGTVLTEITRATLAHRVCPELRIRWAYARWSQAVRLLTFGGKSLANQLSHLLLYQTNRILVVTCLGPAVLAVYARPASLVRHAQTFVWKFAFVFTPTASSLQATGRRSDLRDLLVEGGRYAAYLALPMIVVLVIFGDVILRFWMGVGYERGLVLAILAAGHFLPMTMRPIVNILTGMNAHGRVAVASLAAAICSVGLGILVIGYLRWGLVGAALSVVVPLIVVYGIYVPIYACRQLDMPIARYLISVNRGPVLCAIPLALCLLLGRFLFSGRPFAGLGAGLTAGTLWLGVIYWRYVVPRRIRERILRLGTRNIVGADVLQPESQPPNDP